MIDVFLNNALFPLNKDLVKDLGHKQILLTSFYNEEDKKFVAIQNCCLTGIYCSVCNKKTQNSIKAIFFKFSSTWSLKEMKLAAKYGKLDFHSYNQKTPPVCLDCLDTLEKEALIYVL